MAICGSPNCGCAFTSSTLEISNVDGLVTIEQAEFTSIDDMQEDIDNLQAAVDTLPTTYVNTTGDTMTGQLAMYVDDAAIALKRSTAGVWTYITFQDENKVRRGYIGLGSDNNVYLWADTVGLIFGAFGFERMRIDVNGSLLVGKSVEAVGTAGCAFHRWGNMHASTNILSTNFYSNKTSVADVNGQAHAQFASAGTVIGSITRATASTVAFNTTSDEDVKENMVAVDDELALLWMRTIQPLFFNYKNVPEVRHVGYSAQRVAEVWPNGISNGIVSPGHGNIADRTWDEDGNETTPRDAWQAWMMDHSKLTPILHSCVQALDRTIEARGVILDDHETRITTLEESLVEGLESRIATLEGLVNAQAAQIADLQDMVTAQAAEITALQESDAVAGLRDEVFYTRTMAAGWQFSTSTAPPPTAGQLRITTALTEMYLHKTDRSGYSRATALNFIVARTALDPDCVRFRIRGTSGSVLELRTRGTVVDSGTYLTIPIVVLAGTAADKGVDVEVTLLSEIWSEDPPI